MNMFITSLNNTREARLMTHLETQDSKHNQSRLSHPVSVPLPLAHAMQTIETNSYLES